MWRLSLAMLAAGACAAPQQPGAARIGYATMATVDGATLGAIGGLAACALLQNGFSHGHGGTSKLVTACTGVGAVVGGAATLYGTLESETEPRIEHWLMVPIIPAIYVIGGVVRLVD
jgi:hypothetical protein